MRLVQHPSLRSLKTRVTLAVLLVFVATLWTTLVYISQTLTTELKTLLWAQQYSTATLVASHINQELEDRLDGLQRTADIAEESMPAGPAAWQAFINEKPVLHALFNGGILVHGTDGTAIASYPVSADRVGVNYRDIDIIAAALDKDLASISSPIIGKKLKQPVFGMAVPVHDRQGHVVGALSGVINLGLPNFLDQVTVQGYAKTGSYYLVDPVRRQILASSEKDRIMEIFPAVGLPSAIEAALNGYEGTVDGVDRFGQERLMATRRVPATGWMFAISLPTSEAYAPIYDMQRRMGVIGVLATLLIGVVTGWIVWRRLAPMGAAAEALESMFSHQQVLQAIPVVRDDEVGQLVSGFNKMIRAVAQREAELRGIQAELEGTLNAIPDLLFECNLDGHVFTYRANRADQLFDEFGGIVGQRISDVLPHDVANSCFAALQQAQEQGHSVGQQFQHIVGDRSLWYELSVARKPQVGEAPDLFVVLVRNVTESTQAQQELRQSRDELRALANRLQNGREEQRAHLAREIHDVLAQELTRLKIDLSWMQRRLGVAVDEPLRENLLVRVGQATALVDRSITTVQRIATELRPVILDSLGLFAALEWQVEDFAQRTGVKCATSVPQNMSPPGREISIALFRILQESLTNIARHSHATEVQVRLALESDGWLLTVKDNGVGLMQEQVAAHHSLGLLGMGERALAVGGSVHFAGDPCTGTTITVHVPKAGANA